MTQYRSSEGQDSWKAPTQLKGSALLSNAVQRSLPDGNIITIELSLGGHFNKLEIQGSVLAFQSCTKLSLSNERS